VADAPIIAEKMDEKIAPEPWRRFERKNDQARR